jgi:hypothetical protein
LSVSFDSSPRLLLLVAPTLVRTTPATEPLLTDPPQNIAPPPLFSGPLLRLLCIM